MRFLDLCKLTGKGLNRWALVSVLGIVLSTFCFLFAGTIWYSVYLEKEQPCELTVVAPKSTQLSDQTVSDIFKIPHVTAATGVLEVPVTLTVGKYSATLTLSGIDGNYLKNAFRFGGRFPETSAMPYIVLNDAAVKAFIDPHNPPPSDQADYEPAINWMNAGVALSFGSETSAGTKPITSKVCGILSGDGKEQAPAGYVSNSVAKELLRNQKMPAGYSSVAVRIRNIGFAEDVTKKITALGYGVTDPNTESESKWDAEETEMSYLIIVGMIGLVCFSFLIASVDRGNLNEQRDRLGMMKWIGMPLSTLKKMLLLQTAMISATGVLVGMTASYLIPSFIPAEQAATSVFAMQASLLVAIPIGLLSVGVYILPVIYAVRKLGKLGL
jgi:hypothetical protein